MNEIADILKLAIEKEIHAKVFYSKASEITKTGESQMVFLELAEMEDGHARRLVDRFGDLLQQEGFDAAAHLQQQEAAKEQVLSVEESELISEGAMPEVLEFAIEMEIRARDNYRKLATQVTEVDLQSFCEELAAEEQKHHDLLSKLRISLDMPLDERPAL